MIKRFGLAGSGLKRTEKSTRFIVSVAVLLLAAYTALMLYQVMLITVLFPLMNEFALRIIPLINFLIGIALLFLIFNNDGSNF